MTHYKHAKIEGAELEIRDDLSQLDLEKYTAEYRKLTKNKPAAQVPKVVFDGAIVRAALKSNWLVDVPDKFSVSKSPPRLIRWMSETIDKHYTELVTVPNE